MRTSRQTLWRRAELLGQNFGCFTDSNNTSSEDGALKLNFLSDGGVAIIRLYLPIDGVWKPPLLSSNTGPGRLMVAGRRDETVMSGLEASIIPEARVRPGVNFEKAVCNNCDEDRL